MSVANSIQKGDFDLNLVSIRKPLEFPDGTIQDTAYTGGGGIPTLEEVLIAGDDAQGNDILGVNDLEVNNQIQLTPAGNVVNFVGEINQIALGLGFNGNQLQPTLVSSNAGQGVAVGLIVADNTLGDGLYILPNANDNLYNPVVQAGDIAIVAQSASQSLTIAPDSATTCGLRMTDNSITMGSGGNADVPTNYFQCSGGVNYIVGNSTINNGIFSYATNTNRMITSAPSIDGASVPAFEILYYHLTGNAGTSSATMNLAYNVSATTNYAVFPSIYYGYSGSGGTYNAGATSSACGQIVINGITPTQFTWFLSKNTGDNVNIYLTFLVVYNQIGSDYPKNY